MENKLRVETEADRLTAWHTAARERLAALAHERWSHWMNYLFSRGVFTPDGECILRAGDVERWQRQCRTSYAELPEEEKASDRVEAEKYLVEFGKLLGALAELGRSTRP